MTDDNAHHLERHHLERLLDRFYYLDVILEERGANHWWLQEREAIGWTLDTLLDARPDLQPAYDAAEARIAKKFGASS